MIVRELRESDIPTLKQWHAESGFDYDFPDLLSGEFESVMVVEADGELVLALPAKKTIEMYCLLNKSWRNPRWRLEAFSVGHEAMRRTLLARGHVDCNAWVPPQVERSFGRRLTRLFRWTASRWKSYSRRLED